MLRLAAERESLSVVQDQIGAPTGADLIADVTAHAISRACSRADLLGIYHLAASGETSWYDYARYVLQLALQQGLSLKTPPEAVVPVRSCDYKTAAPRPLNSRLDTQKLTKAFGLTLPNWQNGVARMFAEISEKKL
jgi:dTDP-4-dehydrorhamnose reductase